MLAVDTMNHFAAPRAVRRITDSCAKALRPFSQTTRQPQLRRYLQHQVAPPSLLRNSNVAGRFHQPTHLAQQARHESTTRPPRPLTDRPEDVPEPESPKEEAPSYEMTFTCRVCTRRSSHRMTKQGYHHGTILITCPGCKNRHLIADHLKASSTQLTPLPVRTMC